jgi:hypothetical protein
MGDDQLQREEEERYRKIDRVIEKADADSDAKSDDQDGDDEKPPESGADA